MSWEPERWQPSRLNIRYLSGRKQLRQISIGVVEGLTRWPSLQEAAQQAGHNDLLPIWGCALHATGSFLAST